MGMQGRYINFKQTNFNGRYFCLLFSFQLFMDNKNGYIQLFWQNMLSAEICPGCYSEIYFGDQF